MTQRRFGPTLDAGTVIIEKESEKQILASALGSTGYIGILERGAIGELILCSGKRDMLAKVGGYIPDSLLPDVCSDFWSLGEGAGVLALQRVTDGNEVKGTLTFYDRKSPRNAVLKVDAKNGGGWAGRRQTWVADLAAVPGDITSETTVDLPIAFSVEKDQLKGGTLSLKGATPGSYEIIGNDASDGIAKTEVRLAADSTALTDYGAGVDEECTLVVTQLDSWGRDRNMAIVIKDGQRSPATEWGMEVYIHGELVRSWPDLSSDPNAYNYFLDIINNDTGNHYITVTDLWTGAITAACRPANHFGAVASATEVTETGLNIGTVAVLVDTSGAASNTIAAFTYGSKVIPDTYTITYNLAATKWIVTSVQQATHAFPQATTAVPYVADNDYSIGFTVTEVGPLDGDHFVVTVIPLVEDEVINGRVYFPDEATAPVGGWNISDNTETTVTISVGDLTLGGTLVGTVNYRLEYKQEMWFGYDGIAAIGVTDFTDLYDISSSKFNGLNGKGYGLVKLATPGITELLSTSNSALVEKAGIAYVEAKNYQYREEIPKAITDEFAARTRVQDTVGKSDFKKVIFPSYAYVSDPVLSGRLKQIPITGMVHGREAKVARDYNGYHKVAAGINVTMPRIVKLPTGDVVLNGEILNAAGIPRVEKKDGNFVIWGARIPSLDPAFVYCQKRELLSHYEHVLQENFDYIIFAINDKAEWPGLIAALKGYFKPEWRKRALRGATFEEACSIKVDAENNTDATMAAGEMNAEVKLKLADTVEQFIITVSKIGVHEEVSA